METITFIQFAKFIILQNSGIINMFDVRRGCEFIGETKDVYRTIMENYSELRTKYKTELEKNRLI